MRRCRSLAYGAPDEMIFGHAVFPMTVGFGLRLGQGVVVPELKYAPRVGLEIDPEALERGYRRITVVTIEQALALGADELMLELELLPEHNELPDSIARIASGCKGLLADYHSQRGLHCALRVTVADARRPECLRTGREAAELLAAVEAAASSGADVISLETVGGVEAFAHAAARQDLAGALFAVGLLGARDVGWLWPRVVEICGAHGVAAGGDSAGSTANTAMMLASGAASDELSHVFAAAVRAVSAARSLVAFEAGATGPDKDGGYESAILKAAAGCPTSMQSRAFASHELDVLGRLPGVVCDLWSNEVIEYVGVGGGGTRVYTGILEQDVQQYNVAAEMGIARQLRDRIVETDKYLDPQSFVLSPDVAFEIAAALVEADDDYLRARSAARAALAAMEREREPLCLGPAEAEVLARMQDELESLPDDPERFAAEMLAVYGPLTPELVAASYGLTEPYS